MDLKPGPPRWARYTRRVDGGEFSLEANTEASPEAGIFFLLLSGRVLLRTCEFAEAEAAYKGLCRAHWRRRITSDSPAVRLASAWGLLGLDIEDAAAADVIRREGTDADRTRAEKNRRRKLAHARSTGRGRAAHHW